MIKHQRRTFASTLIASLALLALLVFAAMQMAKGVGDIRNGAASEKWPAVSGFVTHAEMQKTRRRRGSSYHAHVQYSYAVAG